MSTLETAAAAPHPRVPPQPSERRAWLLAALLAALGLAVLVAALSGALGGSSAQAPPPIPVRAQTPSPAAGAAAAGYRGGASGSAAQRATGQALPAPRMHISRRWMEGFYPIYATAQSSFGVNWLLLASIHMQETAFSTAAGTYHGLNFAGCCGGPMQFNVTNGRVTTWDLVRGSYRYGRRPSAYDHMTARHPSIYDDFDAIMAAAHLLSTDGAGARLDGSAWQAAYDYYGHGEEGVAYADQVLARAIGWSQHGFCINCGVRPSLLTAVDAAWGAPARSALAREAAQRAREASRRTAARRAAALRARRRRRSAPALGGGR